METESFRRNFFCITGLLQSARLFPNLVYYLVLRSCIRSLRTCH